MNKSHKSILWGKYKKRIVLFFIHLVPIFIMLGGVFCSNKIVAVVGIILVVLIELLFELYKYECRQIDALTNILQVYNMSEISDEEFTYKRDELVSKMSFLMKLVWKIRKFRE